MLSGLSRNTTSRSSQLLAVTCRANRARMA
jgi:hypothetical protein